MKKTFNTIANVISIVFMCILFIGSISIVAGKAEVDPSLLQLYEYIKIAAMFLIVFSICTVIVSSLALAKQTKPLKIAVIVLLSIIALLEMTGTTGLIYGLVLLVAIGFEVASLCGKDPKPVEVNSALESTPNPTSSVPNSNVPKTIEERIAELKHYKELSIISDEKYEELLQKILDEVK